MYRISDVNKIDVAIPPAAINGAQTGQFFTPAVHRKSLFVAAVGIMAAGATVALQVMQATDALGTGAKVITGATATITGNTKVSVAKLAIVTAAGGVHVAGQTVTINGLVFTAAAADVPTTREYAVGTSGADSAANLLAKINSTDEAIGIPNVVGVSAVVGSDTILTLTASDPGDATITAVASAATTVVTTALAAAFVEVDAAVLDTNNEFAFVAMRVTNSASMQTSVSLIRGNSRYTPEQQVAASYA